MGYEGLPQNSYLSQLIKLNQKFNTMKYKFANKPARCLKCGSDKIAEILYGLLAFSDGLREELDSGKIVLGGCCVSDQSPTWKCTSCGTVIHKLEIDFDTTDN